MARFRFVLLGAGFFARKWLETLKACEDCEVVGLASRTRIPAEELQRDFGLSGATLFADWNVAISQGKADGVIITLPQTLHPEAAVLALKAGRHVLCEKPLAVDMAGARAVYDEARVRPGQVLMVNQNYRWRPHIQALRRGIRTMRGGAVVDFGGTMVSQGLETPQEGLITMIGEKGTLHLDGKPQVTLHAQGETRTLPQDAIPEGELGYALAEFLAAVREKRQPETHVAEHIRSLAIALAVAESSRGGAPVKMADLTGFLG